MFERYTDRARRVVVLAQEDARIRNTEYIDSRHLVAGLEAEGEGVAAQVLRDLGVTRDRINDAIGIEDGPMHSGHLRFTDECKRTLELALREALQLGHSYIGTEHMLLGIVRGDTPGAELLGQFGLTPAEVKRAVIYKLSSYQTQAPLTEEEQSEKHLDGITDAAAAVVNAWADFVEASNPLQYAAACELLSNTIADLGSWVPGVEVSS